MSHLRTALAHTSQSPMVRTGLRCLLGCATAALHHALTKRLDRAKPTRAEYPRTPYC